MLKKLGTPNPFSITGDPIVEEPTKKNKFGEVVLKWEAPSKGFPQVAEAIMYGRLSFKILRQKIEIFPDVEKPIISGASVVQPDILFLVYAALNMLQVIK